MGRDAQGLKRVCENCVTHPKGVIPNPVSGGCRVGVRDLAFVVESNQTLANHEVPQGYSPAEDGAGSLTPFGMTILVLTHPLKPDFWVCLPIIMECQQTRRC